jgi:hypothetical protein
MYKPLTLKEKQEDDMYKLWQKNYKHLGECEKAMLYAYNIKMKNRREYEKIIKKEEENIKK